MADDKKRIRSPNYPALGLASALEQTEKLFAKIQTHPAAKEVVIKGLGYGTYNGASAGALSAQIKYGLLAKIGEDYKLTDRALAVLHPHSPAEKAEAIQAAAKAPVLFSELLDHFKGLVPNDDLLRSHLIRKGFAASAVTPIVQAFRETVELSSRDSGAYDVDTSAGAGAQSSPKVKIGEYVQWTSNGIDQFRTPERVAWVSDDGKFLRVEGSPTGIPMSDVAKADVPKKAAQSWAEEEINKLFGPIGGKRGVAATEGAGPGRKSELNILLAGDHIRVNASLFDTKSLDRLIKRLEAQRIVLAEQEEDSGEKGTS